MKPLFSSEKMLFDFRAVRAPEGWQIVNDDVMGGVFSSLFESGRTGAVVFSGVISLADSGGFAPVRSLPERSLLSESNGFLTRIRGEDRRYKCTARTELEFDPPAKSVCLRHHGRRVAENQTALGSIQADVSRPCAYRCSAACPGKPVSLGFLISDCRLVRSVWKLSGSDPYA